MFRSNPGSGNAMASLLAMDALARRHGCGGLNPALARAITADLGFASRAAVPPADPAVVEAALAEGGTVVPFDRGAQDDETGRRTRA
jgi:hypothetical protein